VLFGQAFLVFTFSDGKVVRWRDYRARAAAVPTAGASVPDWMAGARYEIIGSGRKEEIWQRNNRSNRSNRSNLHTRSSSPLITRTATSTG
jgi:hypothetical protein